MIEKVTITALIGKNERDKIYNSIETSNWQKISSNCMTAKIYKENNIESISLITPDEFTGKNNKTYRYILLLITFHFKEYIEYYSKHIYYSIRETFPNIRKMDFKIQYIRYMIKIDDRNASQYYNLLKSGFEMKNRGMVRNITNYNVTWQNDDTKILAYLDRELYIKINLDKGKIHSLVRKHGYGGRTVKELLSIKNVKRLEKIVINDYLTAICGSGDYFTLSGAKNIIKFSKYSLKKKERLILFITEISKYNDIEEFLYSVQQGLVEITQKRKTAMDYIRDLNKLGINPLTVTNSYNDTYMLSNLTKIITEY